MPGTAFALSSILFMVAIILIHLFLFFTGTVGFLFFVAGFFIILVGQLVASGKIIHLERIFTRCNCSPAHPHRQCGNHQRTVFFNGKLLTHTAFTFYLME